ncbi:MAG: M28 family metallopeptidase, partial [Actinomycetota bacterium]|nr:M28 family metallopeptidase [Actinomycetota bacterium]
MRSTRGSVVFARIRAAVVAAVVGSLVATGPVQADPNNNSSEKLRAAVTLEGVRRHQAAFQDIATDRGGNRFAGLPGHDDSATYVADQLRRAGYAVTLQEFTYEAFFERTPSVLRQVSPTATTYVNGVDFRIMSYSGSGDVTAPLATPSGSQLGCAPGDFAGFPAGAIALVSRGTCTFRIKTTNATNAGAAAILVYNNIPGVVNGTLGAEGGLSAIASLGLTQALGQALLGAMGSGPVTMHVRTDTDSEPLTTRNVLAETEGGNRDNVVMVGAHLDSVTAGPGINDNGSGSAAILETAVQMAKVKPRNTVRFAWWSAEESGLIGSRHYVTNLSEAERGKIALYLNFDMVGSPNFVRFVYDGDNSTGAGVAGPAGSESIEKLFVDYFNSVGLPSEPTPFNGRSDYGPFIDFGIPSGGLFTGAEGIKTAAQAATYGGTAGVAYDPCYHAACDTYANNSSTGLDQMSDAIAHAVITYAQNTEAINGVKGKGNARS